MSSVHSNNSNSNNSSTLDFDSNQPVAFKAEDNTDAQSALSFGTVPTNRSENLLTKTRTETSKSLYDRGIERDIPQPDINNPLIHNPIFPEEYRLETETGLVKVETLHSMGRIKSRVPSEKEGEEEEELDPEIEFVTFTPNDPENPLNWGLKTRWFYTFILSILVIQAAYGSSSLASGVHLMSEQYHVSTEVSTLAVSLMVIGFAVGPLAWAPMSEYWGRRPVYFLSFALYTIFNIPVALAPNIGTILVCRFLQGCFSSSALAIVGASICDLHLETRGLAIAFFSFCPYSGPVFGGIVNGFISVDSGRLELISWVNMAFAGVMWILVSLIPETYAPIILKNKAKRLRKETGDNHIMTEQEASPMSVTEVINELFLRPLRFIVTEPVLVLICSFIALIYSLLYAFFFAYPQIFGTLYGYGEDKVGLMYIPILIGAGTALLTTPVLEKQYNAMTRKRTPEPEDRLIGGMIGALFPAIALFILGATSYKHIIWVGPASSGIAFGYGMVLLYYSLNNYILDIYFKCAASALSVKLNIRSCGGAAFPLFITQMYQRLGLQWASWLLAFISLAMAIIPFVFYKYGKQLRQKLCKEDYSAHLHMVVD